MTLIVVDERLAVVAGVDESPGLRVIARSRRRGRWRPIDGDRVVLALSELGGDGVVVARPASSDPGAAALAAIGGLMGTPVVRLPAGEHAAAWVVAIAARPDVPATARVLEVVAGLASCEGVVPPVRPAVLARWAARAWRPCGWCGGGGLAGASCGCGRLIPGGSA